PARAASATAATALMAGTEISARSTPSSRDGVARTPRISPPAGFTAMTRPSKPPPRTFRNSVWPSFRSSREAPYTATERGSKNASTGQSFWGRPARTVGAGWPGPARSCGAVQTTIPTRAQNSRVSTVTRGSDLRLDPSDFLDVESLLSNEERLIRDTVRDFVRSRVLPGIDDWFERGVFPKDVATEIGQLGLLGMHLQGYGCAGAGAVSYGLACMELEAGDSGFRSFVSVQGSLAMFPIWKYGSEDQKQEWLPRMARGEAIGCFGLTEPDFGSDPAGMRATARRRGSDWVLNGNKLWIT